MSVTYERTSKCDDHYTPKAAMEPLYQALCKTGGILHIPLWERGRFWDPCVGDGAIAEWLKQKGAWSVIATDIKDGLEYDVRTCEIPSGVDMVVTNPPFSIKKAIIQRFVEEEMPFALLLPLSTLCEKWYAKVAHEIEVVPIYGRLTFTNHKTTAPFYCAWFVSKNWVYV